jgi:hypothetical protein
MSTMVVFGAMQACGSIAGNGAGDGNLEHDCAL